MTERDGVGEEIDAIRDLGSGRFEIWADLTFESATKLLSESDRLFNDHQQISIDMANVGNADSAGLALLLEWMSWARQADRKIKYRNLPEQLLAIAEISELTDILNDP